MDTVDGVVDYLSDFSGLVSKLASQVELLVDFVMVLDRRMRNLESFNEVLLRSLEGQGISVPHFLE